MTKTVGLPKQKRLKRIARDVFGIAELRPGQEDVIRSIAAGRNTLAIMPSGAGKSLCYQVPGLHLPGTTVVISPLISLMKDQVDKLQWIGLPVSQVNSGVPPREQKETVTRMKQGKAEFVFTTAERLTNPDFLDSLKHSKIDFVVIDESHCISEWGHDFRPAYLGLGAAIKHVGSPPVLALTATATDQVIEDIKKQLDLPEMTVINTGIYRPNLDYAVFRTTNETLKQQHLQEHLRNSSGTGLVYCATVKTVRRLKDFLCGAGFGVRAYHGRLHAAEKKETQDLFMSGELKAVVATNAFGMGIDKPDLRFVIHYELPGSLEAYYQETGRAGRDGKPADCILLYRLEDRRTQLFMVGQGAPRMGDLVLAYDTLKRLNADQDPVSTKVLQEAVTSIGKAKMRIVLALLKKANAVREVRYGKYKLVDPDLGRSKIDELFRECEERRTQERERLEQMMLYGQSSSCRWKILHDYFGEPFPQRRCGHCDNCRHPLEEQLGAPR